MGECFGQRGGFLIRERIAGVGNRRALSYGLSPCNLGGLKIRSLSMHSLLDCSPLSINRPKTDWSLHSLVTFKTGE